MTKTKNITRERMIKAIKKAKELYILHDLIVFIIKSRNIE